MQLLKSILFSTLLSCSATAMAQQSVGNPQIGNKYLYCHMSDHGQWTAYALSEDGIHFHDLLCGDSIFSAYEMAGIEGGTRDAYICRKHDNSGYLMVTTDMNNSATKRLGKKAEWDNYGINLLTSDDLIHWKSTTFDFRKGLQIFSDGKDAKRSVYKDWSTINRVWAPQCFWDSEYTWENGKKGGYFIYYSLWNREEDKYDRMFYSYADETFTTITQPRILFDWGYATIDADINYVAADGLYHMMIKKEGGQPGLFTSTSKSLTGPWPEPDTKDFVNFEGNKKCEGVSAYQLAGEDTWRIAYIEYSSRPRNYRICKADKYMRNFTSPQNIEGVNGPQHGSFLRITDEEYDRLQKWSDEQESRHLQPNVNNPVVPGKYADPEILYSNKTGRYYLYPTTDGVEGWQGHDFQVFSSADLKDWKKEGTVIDLATDQVKWAKEYAWAPCAIEVAYLKGKICNTPEMMAKLNAEREKAAKKGKVSKNITYKTFYYFTANKRIGVAVADDPAGPFAEPLGHALLEKAPEGQSGQVIDPDVFQDPKTGKYYLYWGNSYMAVSELGDDMTSIKSTKVLIPRDQKRNYNYNEGTYVFYRDGKYYFMWSENDTRSTYYRVRCLISDSPTEFVRDGQPAKTEAAVVISQDPSKQIFGTGHHAVIQKPGTDEWYIVYHRFARPDGVKLGWSAGYNREVCIDRLQFKEDGTIVPVKPSL